MKLILPFILCGLISCISNIEKHNINYVDKFEHENFDDFVNKSFFIRGFDKDGDPIIFVYDLTKKTRPCDLLLGITINIKTKTIKKVDKSKLPDSCNIDEKTSCDLALRFYDYNINRLKVDENRNVYLSIMFKEKADYLVRFSDMKYKTEKYKDWEQLRGNWFQKKADLVE
jgi:hypothetical protein